GNLWFVNTHFPPGGSHGASIGKVTPAGETSSIPVFPYIHGDRDFRLVDLVATGDGHIWFAGGEGGLGRVTPAGAVEHFAVDLDARWHGGRMVPRYLAADADGSGVWLAGTAWPGTERVVRMGSTGEIA